ncbi:MAG: Lrp/AsnC family transcriptional regulator [Clostridiales bacterium]|nr:Lrp/AsnC family transcriptional regulator [Clostridiales bacterium]
MDKLACEVLALLKQDARLTPAAIAKTLGTTEAEVKKTVKSLEERGVILGYTTITDDSAIDSDSVEALIEVKVNPMYGRGFDAIAEDIYKFDRVKSLYLMSGGYDLAVFVEGKNLREVAAFVSEKLSVMDKVLSTATHFILKKYKIGGEMTVADENRRQPVTP